VAFSRAHHEAWKRGDLNQRQYCEAEDIPLKAFGNRRVRFKGEPQPSDCKLLYRRRGLSPPVSHPLSYPLSPMTYPFLCGREDPLFRDRARVIDERFGEAHKRRILDEAAQPSTSVAEMARRYGIDRRVLRRWKQELAEVTAPTFVTVQIGAIE
jgi:hypothetical protein